MTEIKSADTAALSMTPASAAAGRRRFWIFTLIALGVVGASVLFSKASHRTVELAFHPHLPDLSTLAPQPLAIKIHLAAAVLAIALGALMMLSRKGKTFHRTAGWIWVCVMAVVAGSSLFITGLNGDKWSFIHLLSGWVLLALPLAVIAARRHNVQRHRGTMMGLFYGGLLIAGALAFIPGRLMWNLFLG